MTRWLGPAFSFKHFFDWSSGFGGDSSGQLAKYPTRSRRSSMKILVRLLIFQLHVFPSLYISRYFAKTYPNQAKSLIPAQKAKRHSWLSWLSHDYLCNQFSLIFHNFWKISCKRLTKFQAYLNSTKKILLTILKLVSIWNSITTHK